MNINRKISIIIAVCLIGGFLGGFFVSQYYATGTLSGALSLTNITSGQPKEVDFGLFWQVWSALHAKYVDQSKLNTQALVNGAIKGMVESADDPYTVFFEPATSKKFREEISGSFSGVGMEIGKRNNILTVIAPLKDSPAEHAGITAGDKILKIDGKDTSSLAVDEAVNIIRGKKGTKVTLTIARGNQTPKELTIIRDTIKVPAVDWSLVDNHVAYIRIFSFSENVDSEFEKAAQEILKSKADSIVVDLRNNPGGLLDSAINIAGWFLEDGKVVVSEDFGNGTKNMFSSNGNAALKTYPIVMLINGGSASASEILAGALHDNRNIKLIGEKSFGKGSVQELESFNNGSSLKVTIAKWLTPNGISISEKGINADIEVKIEDKDVEQGNIELGTPGKDPQLDKALDLVKNL